MTPKERIAWRLLRASNKRQRLIYPDHVMRDTVAFMCTYVTIYNMLHILRSYRRRSNTVFGDIA